RHLHSFPTRRSSDLIRYCVKSLVPIEKKSTCSASSLIRYSTDGISTIIPIGGWVISTPLAARMAQLFLINSRALTTSDTVLTIRSEEHTSELQSREN